MLYELFNLCWIMYHLGISWDHYILVHTDEWNTLDIRQDAKVIYVKEVLEHQGSESGICGFRWILNGVLSSELQPSFWWCLSGCVCQDDMFQHSNVEAVKSDDWLSAVCLLVKTCQWANTMELTEQARFSKVYLWKVVPSFSLPMMFSLWHFWHLHAVYLQASRKWADVQAQSGLRHCIVLHYISSLTRTEKTRGNKGHVIVSYMYVWVQVWRTPTHTHTHTHSSVLSIIHLCDLLICLFLFQNGIVFPWVCNLCFSWLTVRVKE